MTLRNSLLAIALLAGAAPALAATDGTPGPTSTGTVTINASITPEVAISGLDDINFDATLLQTALNTGGGGIRGDNFCVWSNNVDGSYFMTATGDGAAGAFTLTDGTRTLPYTVALAVFTSGGGALTSGTKAGPFLSNATTPDCGGSFNTNLTIRLANADIAAMEATTTYTGVLTLLVTPS